MARTDAVLAICRYFRLRLKIRMAMGEFHLRDLAHAAAF